jgi:hypothetical protein
MTARDRVIRFPFVTHAPAHMCICVPAAEDARVHRGRKANDRRTSMQAGPWEDAGHQSTDGNIAAKRQKLLFNVAVVAF